MLLLSYKHHSETNQLEKQRGTLRIAEKESERFTNQLGSQNIPAQYKVQHIGLLAFAKTKDHIRFPLTPLTCTCKLVTSLQT